MIENRLNSIASLQAQEDWLHSRVSRHSILDRSGVDTPKNENRLNRLKSESRWNDLRAFLRRYVEEIVFEPFITEGEFLSITVHDEPWVRVNVLIQ
jgi:hypothetical protein